MKTKQKNKKETKPIETFYIVHLSLDVVGLLSENTGKNPRLSWFEPGTPLFLVLFANH